jgi:hypothetical protein
MTDVQSDEARLDGASVRDRKSVLFLLAISALGILLHCVVFPFPPYIHPDTTGLIIAGETLANEGKAVQPYRWDYVFEVLGKFNVSDEAPVVDLSSDQRVPGEKYPPGYSWLVALGVSVGLSASDTCQVIFYLTLFLTSFCWLFWAQRCDIGLGVSVFSLLPLLMSGPATVTDPLGYLAASVLFAALTCQLTWRTLLMAVVVMAYADLTRYAAILLVGFWFMAWMTRRIDLRQRFWVGVSCAIVFLIDIFWKKISSGGLDPMSQFSGGWPNASEVVRASVYACLGGWTPESVVLKAIFVACVANGVVGVLHSFRLGELPGWVLDVIILQFATFMVLVVAQYKYGADFTQAPVAIARYWRYGAPGLICVHHFGISYLYASVFGLFKIKYRFVSVLPFGYLIVLLLSTVQLMASNRDKWVSYRLGQDGFLRREREHEVHVYVQQFDPQALLADNHEEVFGAIEPKRTKSIFYMDGFEVSDNGLIAFVSNSTQRGLHVKEVLDQQLEIVDYREFGDRVSVGIYRATKGALVLFDDAGGKSSQDH